MPRNYNINGDQRGVSGAGRAYTPQVTPWERDEDDVSVARREHFEHRYGGTTHPASDKSAKDDGDVWNRQDLQPTYDLPATGEDDHREPGRDNNTRSFARDTMDDTQGDAEVDRDNRESPRDDNDRVFARDTLSDTGVDTRDFGRINDGLSQRKP